MMYRPFSAAFAVSLVLVVLSTAGIVYLAFLLCNHAPAAWFCDYGETPSPKAACGTRFSYRRVGIPCTVLLCVCNALCFFSIRGMPVQRCIVSVHDTYAPNCAERQKIYHHSRPVYRRACSSLRRRCRMRSAVRPVFYYKLVVAACRRCLWGCAFSSFKPFQPRAL